MKTRSFWITAAVLAGLGLAAFLALRPTATAPASATRPAAAAAPASPPPGSQALELAGTDVALVRQAELARTLAVSGGLRAVNSALVKARVAGELRSLSVREGDRVRAGQVLGQIDDTEFRLRLAQAEEQAQGAAAQLAIAERALENNRQLVSQGFISRNALDTAVSNADAARATLQAARAAAALARKSVQDAVVRTPIDGLVAQRLAQPGERVALDARIVEVVDIGRLELEAAIAPEDVVQLRVGQPARLQVDGISQPLAARVVRINPSAQTGTRAVSAYLALPPEAGALGLRQGLFARGQVELQRRSARVVPASALRVDQARPQVLAVVDGVARAQRVVPGARGEADFGAGPEPAVELTEGPPVGTPVLRGTVGALRDGTRVRLPGEMPTAPAAAAASTSASASAPAALR